MAIGFVWLFWLHRSSAAVARALAAIGCSMFAVTVAAWVVDPPAVTAWAAEQDRMSIIFVSLAGGIAIAGTAAAVGIPRLWTTLLAGVSAVAWIALFPVVLGGTAGLLPADISQAFLGDILEMRPIASPAQALSILAPAFIAAVWLGVRSFRARSLLGAYAVACAGLVMLAAAAHVRFGTYPALFAAGVLPTALSGLENATPRMALLAAALLLPRAPDFAAMASAVTQLPTCTLRGTDRLLARYAGRVVLANVNDTPDLLWTTTVRTVGSLYHRSPDGFMRLRAAWQSEAGVSVPHSVRATEAEFILICPGSALPGYIASGQSASLAETLGRGEVPPWLRRIGVAEPGGMVLYMVGQTD
jgi:hypothetical protein